MLLLLPVVPTSLVRSGAMYLVDLPSGTYNYIVRDDSIVMLREPQNE
jgi:hypothetical protein